MTNVRHTIHRLSEMTLCYHLFFLTHGMLGSSADLKLLETSLASELAHRIALDKERRGEKERNEESSTYGRELSEEGDEEASGEVRKKRVLIEHKYHIVECSAHSYGIFFKSVLSFFVSLSLSLSQSQSQSLCRTLTHADLVTTLTRTQTNKRALGLLSL